MESKKSLALITAFLIACCGTAWSITMPYLDDFVDSKYATDAQYVYSNPLNNLIGPTGSCLDVQRNVSPPSSDKGVAWNYLVYCVDGNSPKIDVYANLTNAAINIAVARQNPGSDPLSPNWERDIQFSTVSTSVGFKHYVLDVSNMSNYQKVSRFWVRIGAGTFISRSNYNVFIHSIAITNNSGNTKYSFQEEFNTGWKNKAEFAGIENDSPLASRAATNITFIDESGNYDSRLVCSNTSRAGYGPENQTILHYEFSNPGYLLSDPCVVLTGYALSSGSAFLGIKVWDGFEWQQMTSAFTTLGTMSLNLAGNPNFQNLPVLKVDVYAEPRYGWNPPYDYSYAPTLNMLAVIATQAPTADRFYRFTERFLSDDWQAKQEYVNTEYGDDGDTFDTAKYPWSGLSQANVHLSYANDYPSFNTTPTTATYNTVYHTYEFSVPNSVLSDPIITLNGAALDIYGYGYIYIWAWDPVAHRWLSISSENGAPSRPHYTFDFEKTLCLDFNGDPHFQNLSKVKVKIGAMVVYGQRPTPTVYEEASIGSFDFIAKITPAINVCGGVNQVFLNSDLNKDCIVDFTDLNVIGLNWLTDSNP